MAAYRFHSFSTAILASAVLMFLVGCATHHPPTIQAPSKNETFRGPVIKVNATSVTIRDKTTQMPVTFKISPRTTVFGSTHYAYATIKDLAVGQYIAIDYKKDRLRIFILRWQY